MRTVHKGFRKAMAENPLRYLVDFGSTFTKLLVVDVDKEIIVCRYQVPSTVQKDITLGLRQLLEMLKKERGIASIERESLLACSSAAGGLRMVTVGLVPSLSSEAGIRAALGAGAKVIKSFSYNLNHSDINEIDKISPDIILLIGGTDGGDKKVIIHNAGMLLRLSCRPPILVAGNRDARDEIEVLFQGADRNIIFADNVMPSIGTLSVDPCREAIRRIFTSHIIKAKGIDKAVELVDETIVPTPSAVLRAAELLANGLDREKGLGELMVVDVGGATTDVYSIAKGHPTRSEAMFRSLPEPYAKRTVEGDLGVRHNMDTLIEIGEGRDAIHEKEIDQLKRSFSIPSSLPKGDLEITLDGLLAGIAVDVAGERHCGRIKVVMGSMGEIAVQEGKDLSEVQCVIGTGGPVVFARDPGRILNKILYNATSPHILKPKKASLFVDGSYMMYAMGLLSRIEPEKALRIMKKTMIHCSLGMAKGTAREHIKGYAQMEGQ
jgi:uncharacterized protein (TIGR01319 family)